MGLGTIAYSFFEKKPLGSLKVPDVGLFVFNSSKYVKDPVTQVAPPLFFALYCHLTSFSAHVGLYKAW